MMIFRFSAIMVFLLVIDAHSQETTIIDQWYTALKRSDGVELTNLLSEDARIENTHLGIKQTKAEFIEALDTWREIAEDLTLTYTYEGVDATSATAEVCYRFKSNQFTNLETFVVIEGQITRHTQERTSDHC